MEHNILPLGGGVNSTKGVESTLPMEDNIHPLGGLFLGGGVNQSPAPSQTGREPTTLSTYLYKCQDCSRKIDKRYTLQYTLIPTTN